MSSYGLTYLKDENAHVSPSLFFCARGFPAEHHNVAGPSSSQSSEQDQRNQAQSPTVCGWRDVSGDAGPQAAVAERGEYRVEKGWLW